MPTIPEPTILDYYEFSKLATAAYIKMEGETTTAGAKVAFQANDQERLPFALAQQMFVSDPLNNPNPVWKIDNKNAYHGNDDETGFAATLFERDGKKVLAIRGTEPFEQTSWGVGLDLYEADIGQIGMIGLALDQTVSMINFIAQLRADEGTENVDRLELIYTDTPPSGDYVTLEGLVSDKYAQIVVHENDIDGYGLIGNGEQIQVTGHSLGGHLATMAARLFPSLITEAYTYNAPGFDPNTVSVAAKLLLRFPLGLLVEGQQLTDEFVDLFAPHLPETPDPDFSSITNYNLESEDLVPGNDSSLVASIITGAGSLGEETFVTTEGNSHLMEPFMDSLSIQALLYSIDDSLTLTDMTELYQVSANTMARAEETILESLHKLFKNKEINLETIDIVDGPDLWLGIGDIDDRRNYYTALLDVENSR
jgi:pimeloyl-ACP methyl ester carboxylesterase